MVPVSEVQDGACKKRAAPHNTDDPGRLRRTIVLSLRRRYGSRLDEEKIEQIADAAIAGLNDAPIKNFVPILAMRHAHKAAAKLTAGVAK